MSGSISGALTRKDTMTETMERIGRRWRYWLHRMVMRHRTQAELESENRELRNLVAEMYEWTHYKHTRWAIRAAKVLGRNT